MLGRAIESGFFETQVQAVGAGFDFLGKTQLVQLQMYLQIRPRLPRFTGAIATDAGRELAGKIKRCRREGLLQIIVPFRFLPAYF